MAFEHGISLSVKVREVMSSPVISVSPSDTVLDAAKKMSEARVGSAVVMERGQPIGILTEGDIIKKVVSKDLIPSSVKVSEVMSSPLITVKAESSLMDAARLMNKYGVKRLGVVYKDELVGIISMTDIISVFPELMDIASEKVQLKSYRGGGTRRFISGYCDNCGQWSDFLLEIDGRFLCEECREELYGKV